MNPIIDKIKTNVRKVGSGLVPPKKSPDELLGELFEDVQVQRIHADGKTFVDAIPLAARRKILKDYEKARLQPGFNLHDFVERYFGEITNPASYQSNPKNTPKQHIEELWTVLTRYAPTNTGSILALPHAYVVPGGRFQEQFYWDSYFVDVGLPASDRWDLISSMMKNYKFMIRKIGYIPTANRTYFLSRSQPPFFSQMVRLIAEKKGNKALVPYLPYLLKEYQFWMAGKVRLSAGKTAHRRVVKMADGSILNRYYDDKATARPESYTEDLETARESKPERPQEVYLDLRAAAESGWDFTSRWLRDAKNLDTIHTTEIIPVDLNCLMLMLEQTIADTYDYLKQPLLASVYRKKAIKRAAAIRRYCWNEEKGFYFDYDFVAHKQTPVESLAGVFPLYAGVAYPLEAVRVAKKLEKDFLKPGGLVATTLTTGQQWDAPNGWAPLQWISIVGLRNYKHDALVRRD